MPKYKYNGQSPCHLGTALVRPGDIVDASATPGKNFTIVEAPKPPAPPRKTRAEDTEE